MDTECFQKLNNSASEIKKLCFIPSPKGGIQTNSSLISQKSFLDIILYQIKSSQSHLLTKNQNNKNIIKNLKILKNNLQILEIEKKTNAKFLTNKIDDSKIELQNKLYNKSNAKNKRYNDYIRNDKIKRNINNQEKKIDYINEIEQLKMLSFITENEIKKIDFEFKKKINTILNLKIVRFYQEEDLEIDIQNNQLKTETTYLMKKTLEFCQKNLITKVKINLNNNIKLNKIKEKIKEIKINLNNKKKNFHTSNLFNNNNTIIEEPKNNISKTSDTSDDEKNNNMQNSLHKHSSICSKNTYLNIDFDEISKQIHQKMMRSLSNKILKRKNVQINNNFNLNIKLNINFNSIKIIDEKLKKIKLKLN